MSRIRALVALIPGSLWGSGSEKWLTGGGVIGPPLAKMGLGVSCEVVAGL